jgi:hypothetical protein
MNVPSPVTSETHNFGFPACHDAVLVRVATLAERYLPNDPITALMKLRQFGEVMAQLVAARTGVSTEVLAGDQVMERKFYLTAVLGVIVGLIVTPCPVGAQTRMARSSFEALNPLGPLTNGGYLSGVSGLRLVFGYTGPRVDPDRCGVDPDFVKGEILKIFQDVGLNVLDAWEGDQEARAASEILSQHRERMMWAYTGRAPAPSPSETARAEEAGRVIDARRHMPILGLTIRSSPYRSSAGKTLSCAASVQIGIMRHRGVSGEEFQSGRRGYEAVLLDQVRHTAVGGPPTAEFQSAVLEATRQAAGYVISLWRRDNP